MIQPLDRRAMVATLLLLIVGLATLGTLWADLNQYDVVGRMADQAPVSLNEIQGSDDWVSVTGTIYLVAFVLSTITFVLWFSLAYRNMLAMGAANPRYGPRWAVWSWFIPILNFFRPKQVMNDIWRGSDPRLQPGDESWQDRSYPALLNWWWGAWLISGIVLRMGSTGNSTTPAELRGEVALRIAGDLLLLGAVALAICVVVRVTRRQEDRRLHSGASAGHQESAVPGVPVAAAAAG
jgi:hypothetical protein